MGAVESVWQAMAPLGVATWVVTRRMRRDAAAQRAARTRSARVPPTRVYPAHAPGPTTLAERYTGLDFLVSLAKPKHRALVCQRLKIAEPETRHHHAGPPILQLVASRGLLNDERVPRSLALWMLETDSAEVNAQIYAALESVGICRDILLGVPYGPGRSEPVPVAHQLPKDPDAAGVILPVFGSGTEGSAGNDPRGLVEALRTLGTAGQMKPLRKVAASLGRDDWRLVAAADRELPLPGYARWALAARFNCPAELREQFGSSHPRFAKRFRKEGLVDGPAAYAAEWNPAPLVLRALGIGRWAYPARIAEAEDLLRPLIHEQLDGNVEAWAVLAQLLPTFDGTLPDLVVTVGAIAHGAG
jgi:hypothetical protein